MEFSKASIIGLFGIIGNTIGYATILPHVPCLFHKISDGTFRFSKTNMSTMTPEQ